MSAGNANALSRRQFFLQATATLAAGQALATDPQGDDMLRAVNAWYHDNNVLNGENRMLPGAGIAKACLRKFEPNFDGTGEYAVGNSADGMPPSCASVAARLPVAEAASSIIAR